MSSPRPKCAACGGARITDAQRREYVESVLGALDLWFDVLVGPLPLDPAFADLMIGARVDARIVAGDARGLCSRCAIGAAARFGSCAHPEAARRPADRLPPGCWTCLDCGAVGRVRSGS